MSSQSKSEKPAISQVTVIGLPQPQTWADYRAGALANFGGGHHTDGHLEAFQHGMETVFNVLEREFPPAPQCKAAPELLEALELADRLLTQVLTVFNNKAIENYLPWGLKEQVHNFVVNGTGTAVIRKAVQS